MLNLSHWLDSQETSWYSGASILFLVGKFHLLVMCYSSSSEILNGVGRWGEAACLLRGHVAKHLETFLVSHLGGGGRAGCYWYLAAKYPMRHRIAPFPPNKDLSTPECN